MVTQAQAADAEALLQRTFEIHGGDALKALHTYYDEGTLTSFDPTGNPVSELTFKTHLGLAEGRVRFEAYQDSHLAVVQQLLPEGGRMWMPQVGVSLLPKVQARDLRRSLFQGIFNLRDGAASFDHFTAIGQQTWMDVNGQAVTVVHGDFTTTLLLAEDGTLLGERYVIAQTGKTTVLYHDYKEVGGIKFPSAADVYVRDMHVASQTITDIRINGNLTPVFTPLERLETTDLTITPEALNWVREHAIPFSTVQADSGFADLMPLKKLIGEVPIVALGEQTHGTHDFFRMKHRLLEFLVSEMGFSIFAIEANMPEAYRLNEYVLTGEGDPKALLEGMHFWTWNTQEVLDMIKWIRAYNASGRGVVQFTGFDMQFANLAAENVQVFLEEVDPSFWHEIEDLYGRVRQLNLPDTTNSQASLRLVKPLGEVLAHLETNASRYQKDASASEVAWAIQNARIVAQAAGFPASGSRYRDQAMAENVSWILQQNPGAKAVIWAHNGHVQQREGWMGHDLSERYGNDYLAVGFSMNQGTYTAFKPGEGVTTDNTAGAAPERTVDGFLNATGLPRFILDVRQAATSPVATWLAGERLFRSIGAVSVEDANAFAPAVINRDYDLLVFIAETTASMPLR